MEKKLEDDKEDTQFVNNEAEQVLHQIFSTVNFQLLLPQLLHHCFSSYRLFSYYILILTNCGKYPNIYLSILPFKQYKLCVYENYLVLVLLPLLYFLYCIHFSNFQDSTTITGTYHSHQPCSRPLIRVTT